MEVNAVLCVGDANGKVSDSTPVPVSIKDAAINIESVDMDMRDLTAAQDTVNVAMDGVTVDETHPLAVLVPGRVGVEGDNTADVKVSLDGEAVLIDNTADLKVTLDSEQVSLAETYTGGDAVPGGGPKGIVAMMVKGGHLVPVNDSGNDLPVATKATPGVLTATIAAGDSVSSAVDLGGACLFAIEMPAAFTGTALTFQTATAEAGPYQDLKINNVEIKIAVAQGTNPSLSPYALDFAPWRYVKFRSGTASAPTVEAVAREIKVPTK